MNISVENETSDFLVDVNILAYNHEKYISQAIESVLAQKTNFKYRILIGEDCSNDKTASIIRSYEAKFPDIIKAYYHEKNLGIEVGSKTNGFFLLRKSTSKYIIILDGDDYWCDENKLQKQIDFLETNPDYAACFHRYYTFFENQQKQVESIHRFNLKKDTFNFNDALKFWFIHVSTLVFRRDCIVNLPEWYLIYPCDVTLVYQIALTGNIKFLPDYMSVYRKHDAGLTNDISIGANDKLLKRRKEMMLSLDKNLNYKYTNQINRSISLTNFYFTCSQKKQFGSRLLLILKNIKYLDFFDFYEVKTFVHLLFPKLKNK